MMGWIFEKKKKFLYSATGMAPKNPSLLVFTPLLHSSLTLYWFVGPIVYGRSDSSALPRLSCKRLSPPSSALSQIICTGKPSHQQLYRELHMVKMWTLWPVVTKSWDGRWPMTTFVSLEADFPAPNNCIPQLEYNFKRDPELETPN